MYAGNGTGVFAGNISNDNLPGGSGAGAGRLNFNAANCNSIYGNNEKVMPASFALVAQIRY